MIPRFSVLLALLLCVPAFGSAQAPADSPAPAPQERQQQVYLGAAFLYNLSPVTVVHPASAGEAGRISAGKRAAYLERMYGLDARVAVDDQIDRESLTGNLLVLGWDNRVLGTDEAPRPFETRDGKRFFLGRIVVEPDEELLFISRSPYDREKYVVFWSRIDLEMDRLLPLPFVGSDWAVMRDYVIVHQGMSTWKTDWPPQPDPKAERNHRAEIAPLPERRTSEHFSLAFVEGAFSDDEARDILAIREEAFAEAVRLVGDPGDDFRVSLRVYRDLDEKETWTGAPTPVHSIPRRRETHMVADVARSPAPQEEIHLLARERIGPAYLTSLYQGFATSLYNRLLDASLGAYAKVLLDNGTLPRVSDLLDEETVRRMPNGVAFPAAGLLVGWLRATAGAETFADIYRLKQADLDGIARMLKMPPERCDPSFREWVGREAKRAEAELAFHQALGAARERFRAGDFPGMVEALRRAVQARPEDPQVRFDLASALMRTGAYEEAAGLFDEVIRTELPASRAHLAAFGHYQIGRILDVQGRRKEALMRYGEVLQLPDRHGSHEAARQAVMNPVTAADLN